MWVLSIGNSCFGDNIVVEWRIRLFRRELETYEIRLWVKQPTNANNDLFVDMWISRATL